MSPSSNMPDWFPPAPGFRIREPLVAVRDDHRRDRLFARWSDFERGIAAHGFDILAAHWVCSLAEAGASSLVFWRKKERDFIDETVEILGIGDEDLSLIDAYVYEHGITALRRRFSWLTDPLAPLRPRQLIFSEVARRADYETFSAFLASAHRDWLGRNQLLDALCVFPGPGEDPSATSFGLDLWTCDSTTYDTAVIRIARLQRSELPRVRSELSPFVEKAESMLTLAADRRPSPAPRAIAKRNPPEDRSLLSTEQTKILAAVFDADDSSFSALARLTGLNPQSAFVEADLRSVDFGSDDLTGYLFHGANLCGANLSRTTGLSNAMIQGAVHDASTSWPPGFEPRMV